MVPSLTETLAECGVNLVGRTRYCIHPERIKNLPVVGGTKDLNFQKLEELAPDLLILDQEENLERMKTESPCAVHVFHAVSVSGMEAELKKLAAVFQDQVPEAAQKIEALAERYRKVATAPKPVWDFRNIPGQLKVINADVIPAQSFEKLVYIIWKNPWMKIGTGTYIASVLEHLGAEKFLEMTDVKYPKFEITDLKPTDFPLFSSEPYPFAQKDFQSDLPPNHPAALIDGESYSWFGLRSLTFLEKVPSSLSERSESKTAKK